MSTGTDIGEERVAKPDDTSETVIIDKKSTKGDGKTDVTRLDNPYLQPSGFAVLEWLARKTAKLLSSSDLQRVFPFLVLRSKGKKKKKDHPGPSGRLALTLLTSVDKQIWEKVVSPFPTDEDSPVRLVLESLSHDDVSDVDRWETSHFARALFSLRAFAENSTKGSQKRKPVDNYQEIEKDFREKKAWEITRYKAIHSGFTLWPSWLEAVEEWKKTEVDSSNELYDEQGHDQDMTDAKAFASETDQTLLRRRNTRRGRDASGVFYGNQSGLTLKQLMETLLRIVSQNPCRTLADLLEKVPDGSTDPMRRMRNALGRLVWKRRQLSHLRVNTEWTDSPIRKTMFSGDLMSSNKIPSHVADDIRELLRYISELHETELQLRRLILKILTRLPVSLISSAGDDRPGTLDSADNEGFQERTSFLWQKTGHGLIGRQIYRPPVEYNIDGGASCEWFQIEGYTPSIVLDPEEGDYSQEKPQIGAAKDNTPVERRARFLATPRTGDVKNQLVLTEAQVFAGLKAAEVPNSSDLTDRNEEHPFAGDAGAKIALIPESINSVSSVSSHRQVNGEVVGWESTCGEGRIQHRVLVLPEKGQGDESAFWALLTGSQLGGLTCTVDGTDQVYTVQQFDYHASSDAFKECRAIIGHLQRHSKANPFLEPVDPEALNIPNYFDVIKQPMDITTVSEKLERGDYSNIHPKEASGRTPVARMLNGPFRKDVELIFDNAIAFNPPDDWIYQAAVSLRKYILKKIEQASEAADQSASDRRRPRPGVYVEYDSDVDLYDESEKDDDYEESRQSSRRKQKSGGWSGEDTASKAIERAIKLQKVLGDSQGLRVPLSHLPINSNVDRYSLSSDWNCQRGCSNGSNGEHKEESFDTKCELSDLIALRSQVEEKQASGLRRSTRSTIEPQDEDKLATGADANLIFIHRLLKRLNYLSFESPRNRSDVEFARERLHEEFFARVYHDHFADMVSACEAEAANGGENDLTLTGLFADGNFPPFLGRITPIASPSYKGDVTWEIRAPNVVPAVRWVIRGLIASGHFSEIEPLSSDSMQSGVILPNNVYFIDTSIEPFEVLHQKEIQRRKRANQEESDEEAEEIELSEYEKRRAERVARNADRLKSLGLG